MTSVFFDEPLSLQRQAWILSKIRTVHHEKLVELGCADGPITKLFSRPSLWLNASKEWKRMFENVTGLNSHPFLQRPSIEPREILAIDIDQVSLDGLDAYLRKQKEDELKRKELRFSRQEVQLIHQNYKDIPMSPLILDVDVLVASEFIEHLHDTDLEAFGPTVLGQWRPKVVLITTPNYSFNVKFKRNEQSFKGFKDPTDRTDRRFRHSDHKFEWTRKEFQDWTNVLAKKYGYEVLLEAVGKGYRMIDKEKQADLEGGVEAQFASQCAILTRKGSDEEALPAPELCLNSNIESNFRTIFEKSEGEGNVEYSEEEIKSVFETVFNWCAKETEYGLIADAYSMWLDEDLREVCQGRLETLFPNPSLDRSERHSLFVLGQDVFVRRNDGSK